MVWLAAALAAAGCVAAIDAGQARLCRSILPALNAPGATLDLVDTAPLAGGEGVVIAYGVVSATGRRSRILECRFATRGPVAGAGSRLVAVTTEAGPLGDLRLYVLKRFWLGGDGVSADPEPVGHAADAPVLPRALAIALQHAIFALPPMAIYALLAAAYALVYGLVGRINLAFGEFAAVGGYATFLGLALAGLVSNVIGALLLAGALALTSTALYGAVAGRLLLRPLLRAPGQQVLIATMALAIMLQEYLRLAQGARPLWVQPIFNAPYAVARSGDFLVTLTPVAVAAAGLCLLAGLLLVRLLTSSRFGRAWRATSQDPMAAALFGIDQQAVLIKTMALASVLAGLAGYVITVYYGAFGYADGVALGLKALLAAIAGGIGSVGGAFLGGLLLGSGEALWSALFPIAFRDLATFCVLVLILILRPSGLFGEDVPLAIKPTTGRR
jgi:branched-subunit amino acid ABC-type transport system permease component